MRPLKNSPVVLVSFNTAFSNASFSSGVLKGMRTNNGANTVCFLGMMSPYDKRSRLSAVGPIPAVDEVAFNSLLKVCQIINLLFFSGGRLFSKVPGKASIIFCTCPRFPALSQGPTRAPRRAAASCPRASCRRPFRRSIACKRRRSRRVRGMRC